MQQLIFDRLIHAYQASKLSHAYLFHGTNGSHKKEMVQRLAQAIFCENLSSDSCGECVQCQRIQKNEFPDIHQIQADNQTIKIEQIRHLKSDVSFSSMEHDKKVYIIHDVEKMSVSAANSLLKFLEEPTQQVYFFMTTTSLELVLPTILSRTQVITLQEQNRHAIESMYQKHHFTLQQAYVMSYVFPDVQEGMTLLKQEEFQSFYQTVVSWALQWVSGDQQTYIHVQTKLLRYFSNKDWANIGLDIVMVVVRDALFSMITQQETSLYNTAKLVKIKSGATLENIAQAKRMLSSHVSAQVCYEWLALQVR